MFSLFKKKEESVKVIDKVWISENAKWNGIIDAWRKDPNLVIIVWFNATHQQLYSLFIKETTGAISLYMAREVHSSHLVGRQVIFAEHHPLRSKEQDHFRQWQLKEVVVHSALEEPLFKTFGSDKIIHMMKQLGMKEDEVIEHKLISSSIENAQEKIGKKVTTEHSANSQQEWMERNLPA